MGFLFSLLILAAMVFAIVDIIVRESDQVRYLPKFVWLLLVIFIPLLGIVLWFALGRDWSDASDRPLRPRVMRTRPTRPAHPSRPARPHASARPPAPLPGPGYDTRTTEQQLADLEREIHEETLREQLRRRRQADGSGSSDG